MVTNRKIKALLSGKVSISDTDEAKLWIDTVESIRRVLSWRLVGTEQGEAYLKAHKAYFNAPRWKWPQKRKKARKPKPKKKPKMNEVDHGKDGVAGGNAGGGSAAAGVDNLGKGGQEENGLVPGDNRLQRDNSREEVSISRDEEGAEEEGTAGGSPKDFEIGHMSDSITSTNNDDSDSEANSADDDVAHFFSEEDDSDELTNGERIVVAVRWNRWTPAFNARVWAALEERGSTIFPGIQSKEQLQSIATFVKQQPDCSTIATIDEISRVGDFVLKIEQEASKLTFWSRLSLIRLASWFKDWSEDRVVRDALLAQTTSPHNANSKQVAVLAMNAFMLAMYGSKYTGEDGKRILSKLRKEWGRRRREGFRWLKMYQYFGKGILLIPLFVFEFPTHRLADLNDEQFDAAIKGWSANRDFSEVLAEMSSRVYNVQRTTPLLASYMNMITEKSNSNEEESI